jgi:hypothetical protein
MRGFIRSILLQTFQLAGVHPCTRIANDGFRRRFGCSARNSESADTHCHDRFAFLSAAHPNLRRDTLNPLLDSIPPGLLDQGVSSLLTIGCATWKHCIHSFTNAFTQQSDGSMDIAETSGAWPWLFSSGHNRCRLPAEPMPTTDGYVNSTNDLGNIRPHRTARDYLPSLQWAGLLLRRNHCSRGWLPVHNFDVYLPHRDRYGCVSLPRLRGDGRSQRWSSGRMKSLRSYASHRHFAGVAPPELRCCHATF